MRAVKNNLPTPSGKVEESEGPRWTRPRWEPAWRSSRRREKSGGRCRWKAFPILLLFSVLQKETQEKRIQAIAESVKISPSFVHKTCKNLSPQTLEIPACKN